MTVSPVSSQAQHRLPEAPPVADRERPARHAHGERSTREPKRPAFRRVAIIASVPGLSRTT
jgi:hypothetical protein